MKWHINISLFFIVLMFAAFSLQAQKPLDNLKFEKETLEQEISFTKEKISNLKKKRSNSLAEMVTLRKQINVREELITNINKQLVIINQQLSQGKKLIESLNRDMEQLKAEYSQMIYNTYINKNNYNSLLFVFSSSSFNDAYQRLKYMQEYAKYREKQADLIQRTMVYINDEVELIEERKEDKILLLNTENEQKRLLSNEQRQIGGQIETIKEKENYFTREVRKKEKEAAQLNIQIQKMIVEAARAKTHTAEKGVIALTPEALALSTSFASNKGTLPWPVKRGSLISGFGRQPHPVLKGVETNNNGIDISTTSNAEIRSIYEGEVMNTFYHPVFHRGVIINHGEYFTVYLNLKEVTVHEGDKVKTKQKIGYVFTGEDNVSEVHLEIWKGTSLLNPSSWLYK